MTLPKTVATTAVAVAIAILVLAEFGAINLSSTDSRFHHSATSNDQKSSPTGCTLNLQSNTQFEWKDTLWLALYQRQNGHATTEVSWSEEPPCNHTGTATLVTEGETTCRGLISVDGCRAGLAKAVQQQLEKFQAQLHNAG